MHVSAEPDAAKPARVRRWRLPLVMLLAFAISAALSSIVSASVGGDANTFIGDEEDNSVIGGDGNDTMTGGEGDDFFQGLLGADTLEGQGDLDVLIGDAPFGAFADVLTGGDGNDQIAGFDGNDVLDGGEGSDVLGTIDFSRAGGPATVELGDDTLTGGGGNDILLAGPGDDLLEARDGVADNVDCGEETDGSTDADIAVVDAMDTVVDCETVKLPDTTAPNTRFSDGPPDVIRTANRKVDVTFAFRSTEKKSTFECKLDTAAFTSCTSPMTVSLSRGVHVFKVRATDPAGNVDRSPATREVTIKKRRG